MEKAASSGQFRNLIGSLNMIPENDISRIDGVLIQKAIDQLGNGTTQAEFINWINNGCQLNTVLVNAFTVGDVFRHCAEKGEHRLYLSDNTQNWLIKPNFKKVVPIRTDFGKLSEYYLSQNMNDYFIQSKAGNPGFMSEEEFLYVMYISIFQPQFAKELLKFVLQKDKKYIFHVMVNDKKVTFYVDWRNDGWLFRAFDFDRGLGWLEGDVFLFPTTKAKA